MAKQDSFELHYPVFVRKQCYSVQAARGFAPGGPKTGCLDKLASERRQACAVSKALFAVLSLGSAVQYTYQVIAHSQGLARDLPGIGPPHAP